MLTKVGELIDGLEAGGVRYCHWKSYTAPPGTLSARTDIELLVCKEDASLFRKILIGHFFKPVVKVYGKCFSSMEDYYGLDEDTGLLVNVHAYFRVATGEDLVENYCLPIEEMLLDNTRVVDSMRVPAKGAEIIFYTLRMMMRHASLTKLALLAWDREQLAEKAGLSSLDGDSLDDALDLLGRRLPTFDKRLFSACVEALRCSAPLLRRAVLGYRMRFHLRLYSRYSLFPALLGGARKFSGIESRALGKFRVCKRLVPGGALICFVGPEAAGKSSLLNGVGEWLGEHFAVDRIHAGKPPATALSAVPNRFAAFLRSRFPAYRPSLAAVKFDEKHKEGCENGFPLLSALRSVQLAYDRRSLLKKAFRRAARGRIVLCDRFPSLTRGTPDSPSLGFLVGSQGRYAICCLLARLEEHLYRDIPGPDLILQLSVPLEVAIARNRTRSKEEPEDFVRLRHAQSFGMDFGSIPVYRINTDRPFSETLLEAKRVVWNSL